MATYGPGIDQSHHTKSVSNTTTQSRQNISHQVYFAGFSQLQTQTTVTSLSIGSVQLTQGVHLTHWACGTRDMKTI